MAQPTSEVQMKKDEDGNPEIFVVNADGTNRKQLTVTDPVIRLSNNGTPGRRMGRTSTAPARMPPMWAHQATGPVSTTMLLIWVK